MLKIGKTGKALSYHVPRGEWTKEAKEGQIQLLKRLNPVPQADLPFGIA